MCATCTRRRWNVLRTLSGKTASESMCSTVHVLHRTAPHIRTLLLLLLLLLRFTCNTVCSLTGRAVRLIARLMQFGSALGLLLPEARQAIRAHLRDTRASTSSNPPLYCTCTALFSRLDSRRTRRSFCGRSGTTCWRVRARCPECCSPRRSAAGAPTRSPSSTHSSSSGASRLSPRCSSCSDPSASHPTLLTLHSIIQVSYTVCCLLA